MDLDYIDDLLLTKKELEHRLGVSAQVVYYWCRPEQYKRDKGTNKDIPALPSVITKQGPVRHFIAFPYKQVEQWLVDYRPAIAHKLSEDVCKCDYCNKQRAKRAKQASPEPNVLHERSIQLAG